MVAVTTHCTVKVNVPTAVSVPDRVPFAAKLRPDGGVPEASENVLWPCA